MDAEYIARLVKIADNLFYEKTSLHLNGVEKNILEQILIGKKFDDIQVGTFANDTLKKYWIPKLWKHLSVAFEKKILKINVLGELQDLHKEQRRIIICKLSINRRSRLTKNTYVKGLSLSRFQGKKISCIKSNNSNPTLNHQNTCSVCSNGLTPKEQQLLTSTDAGKQKVEDGATVQTHDWFPSSYQVAATKSTVRTNSTSGGRTYMRYMKSGLPLLLALGVYGVWFSLSWLANWYGAKSYLAGQLPQAELSYKIALKLNPLSGATFYNQGVVYEDRQNYQQAHTQYQKAMELGLVAAYNNQARLYLSDKKYDTAVVLLQIGLPLAKHEDKRIKYSMLKNLGWGRLGQGRLAEAELNLTQAIELQGNLSSAYCLLAQVLEQQGEKQKALKEWENCLRYAHQPQTLEEDKWMDQARQKLSIAGGIE